MKVQRQVSCYIDLLFRLADIIEPSTQHLRPKVEHFAVLTLEEQMKVHWNA